jgi:hypothetical protein
MFGMKKKQEEELIKQMKESLVDNTEAKYAELPVFICSLSDNRMAQVSIRMTPVEYEDVH